MLSITSAQLDAWLASLALPLARILGLFAAAPAIGERSVPTGVRLALGLAVALAMVPGLPPAPALPAGDWLAVAALAREAVLGLAMGLVLRLVFAGVDFAGTLVGMQMGFSFATLHDPQAAMGPPATARLLGLLAILVFLGMDGHLMLIDVTAHSFDWLPAAGTPLARNGWSFVAYQGVTVFAAGLLLALPLVATLLIAHLALGVLNRAAPQFNLFTAGFSVTMATGLVALPLVLHAFAPVLRKLLEQGLETVGQLLTWLAAG